MTRRSASSNRRRLSATVLVVGSVVAVIASPLATGAANAATTEHYASALTNPTASPSASVTVGTDISVTTNATDDSFTIPSGSGDVDNGHVVFTATTGPAAGQFCSLSYTGGTSYTCNNFESTIAGTSHIAVSYQSGNGDIPDVTTAGVDITWTADNATHLVVSGPSAATLPDSGQTYTITAEDQYGNTDTGFPGGGACLVDVTNSDGTVSSPLNLSGGVGTVTAAFTNLGTGTLTAATDTPSLCALASGGLVANGSENVVVSNDLLDHFDLSLSPSNVVAAGTAVTLHITARAPDGSIVPADENVEISGCRNTLVEIGNVVPGQGSFTSTFTQAGICDYTVRLGEVTGGPIQLTVNPAAATHLVLTAPGTATAGTPVNAHVVAEDGYGNEATSYNGTVQFSNTPGHTCNAILPSDTQLVNGETTVPVTFRLASSSCEITATDVNAGSINGISNAINVSAAAPDHLSVTASPSSVTAGQSVTVGVTVLDQFGNPSTGDSGQCVNFDTHGGEVGVCALAVSGSSASFNVAFFTAGTHHVTVSTNGLSADSNDVTVVAASATHLVVSTQSTAHRGTAIPVTVTAEDQYGNVATSDSGSLSFASNDVNAVLPANGSVSLSGGTATFDVTFFRHATNDAVRVFDSHGNEGQSNPVNLT